MSVYIAYPHTSASAIIGQKCITNLFSVNFFMPNRVDETIGGDILKDIEILASLSDDSDVERTDIPDFSAPDVNVVFFPCLGKYLYSVFSEVQFSNMLPRWIYKKICFCVQLNKCWIFFKYWKILRCSFAHLKKKSRAFFLYCGGG